MKAGIAQKLLTTYATIIISTIISGIFCLYVLNINKRTNEEMRYVTLPSIEELKELKGQLLEVKKLANTWIYMTNNKDEERLTNILMKDFPMVSNRLDKHARKWSEKAEFEYYEQIAANNKAIINNVEKITSILSTDESYLNDSKVDGAVDIYSVTSKKIVANDRLYDELISTKNSNLERQQSYITSLLNYLYLILFATLIVVIVVSLVSLRFSKKSIVEPLLKLNKIILDIAIGEVIPIEENERKDEIGQMHNAIRKMIDGAIQKINFAEQIGKGNYDNRFTLLSESDQLGMALVTMRDDLKKSHEILLEQDKRLLDAQRLARVGNYLYDLQTLTFQSSSTFDEILGLPAGDVKPMAMWLNLIHPDYRKTIGEKADKATAEKSRFSEQYLIRKYNTGEECWVAAIGEHNLDENGEVLSIFGTLQDITESKSLEVDLNNSYVIATEQNKRLSNFSYIVSHNLRMHAVNIHGLLNLYNDSDTEEEKDEVIALLARASQHLDETMHHLNDVVAMQNALSVEIEPQVLNSHIVHALNTLQSQIENRKVIIENRVPVDTIVNYNPAYLDSIILNLISNAIKYSHPDRQPIIFIDFYKEHPERANTKFVLEIKDNGIGIDMHKNGHKLFGMYKTFHNNKDAKGIGLFMTKYQIEAMGGHIEVTSVLNEGTTFKIFIK